MKKNYFIKLSILLFVFIFLLSFSNLFSASNGVEVLQLSQFVNSPNLPHESVATSDDITSLYFNPAGIATHPLQLAYYFGYNEEKGLQDHTFFVNFLGFAFSSQWRYAPQDYYARRHTIGTAFQVGNIFYLGGIYSMYESNVIELQDYSQLDIGAMFRPCRRFSLGVVVRSLNKKTAPLDELESRFDLGFAFRPFPFPLGFDVLNKGFQFIFPNPESFTFSVDTTWAYHQKYKDLLPRYLVEYTPLMGITIYGGWDNYTNTFFGLKYSQTLSQISFQVRNPRKISDTEIPGKFYSGGLMLSRERFHSKLSGIPSFLHISLEKNYSEKNIQSGVFSKNNISFYELIHAIEQASTDSKVYAILITGRYFSGGWARAEELRKALLSFQKKSNKKIIAFLESASNKEYYIASVADTISMPPTSILVLNGLISSSLHIKSLLDKLGIEGDFIRMKKYKSAVEMFTQEEPSRFSIQQKKAILKSLSKTLRKAIQESPRKISSKKIKQIFEEGLFTSSKAKQLKLIDKEEYFSDLEIRINENMTADASWKMNLEDYISTSFYNDVWGQKPAIALLVLNGDIISGRSSSDDMFHNKVIASDNTIQSLRRIANDHQIKGVVIRINSPGGSGLASDLIWKEIQNLKKKKPVVVSFSDVAASGGYYIAMGADNIVSNENTITGSIGVFAGKFSLKNFYKKLGINKIVFKTNKNAALFSETDKFTNQERKMLKKHLLHFYNIFIKRVAKNRTELTEDEIEENAQGKVYTGADAIYKGMVDKIGGIRLAIEMIRQKANLLKDNYVVKVFPKKDENIFSILRNPKLALPSIIEKMVRMVSVQQKLNQDSILFLMPYSIEVK